MSAFKVFLQWCEQWDMQLNITKCKALSITKSAGSKHDFHFDMSYNGSPIHLEQVDEVTDLGVKVDSTLLFKKHTSEKISKAFMMLGIIRRNFDVTNKDIFLLLYKSLVRSHLEYGNSVWNPHFVSLIRDLEKVQKRATKLVFECKSLKYIERLRLLKLPCLRYRRMRSDMIEVYKLMHGIYDSNVCLSLQRNLDERTRGNELKLLHVRCSLDIRKYRFCSRIVGLWNILPNSVVLSPSLDSFKKNFDKFWVNKAPYYDYEANFMV